MRASHGIFALLITLTACSGKKRPFADGAIEELGGPRGSSSSTMEREIDASPGSGVEPTATEGRPPVDVISRPDDTKQSTGSLACGADAASCTGPDAGPLPAVCVPTGSRDCTSEADNDCDGQPDNARDDVCVCLPGTVEPCNEHPGLDGRGPSGLALERASPGKATRRAIGELVKAPRGPRRRIPVCPRTTAIVTALPTKAAIASSASPSRAVHRMTSAFVSEALRRASMARSATAWEKSSGRGVTADRMPTTIVTGLPTTLSTASASV